MAALDFCLNFRINNSQKDFFFKLEGKYYLKKPFDEQLSIS